MVTIVRSIGLKRFERVPCTSGGAIASRDVSIVGLPDASVKGQKEDSCCFLAK